MSERLPEGHRDDATGGTAGPATGPVLGPVGWARWAWRQLTSMRTALFLLLLLAVGAVPGSVVPQRGIDAVAVSDYVAAHPVLAPWLERLGLFEVYASPWFSAIYLLLFVSLIGCVLPRTRAHWRNLRQEPPRTPARLDRLPEHRSAELDAGAADAAEVLAAARAVLRGRRYRVVDGGGGAGGSTSLSAQRGELRESGNLLFHVALIGVLVSVAVGGLLGYRGQAVVPVGKAFANSLTAYDTFDAGALVDPADLPPFRFRLDEVTATFEEEAAGNQFAAPRDFSATVGVTESPDADERVERLRVNEPLRTGGASVYLAGNGYAPRFTVRDSTGAVAFSDQVPFLPQDGFYTSTGVVKVPDASGTQIGLSGLLFPTYVLDPVTGPSSVFPDARDPAVLFTAYTGDLGLDDGTPQNVYVLDTAAMTQLTDEAGQPFRTALRPGQSVALPGGVGTVTLESVDRYAGLTVRHDPARGAALVSAVLAMVGLTASLFIPRRRLWVRVLPAGGAGGSSATRVEVGALARSEDPGLADEADRVLADVLTASRRPAATGPPAGTGPPDPGPAGHPTAHRAPPVRSRIPARVRALVRWRPTPQPLPHPRGTMSS